MKPEEKAFCDSLIDRALKASFGESSNILNVSFKKTVFIRDYETEVIEANSTVNLDKNITGAERVFISALIRVQLEYEAYCNLLMKGMVTQKEFEQRKLSLATELNALKSKAELLLGRSLDNYLDLEIN